MSSQGWYYEAEYEKAVLRYLNIRMISSSHNRLCVFNGNVGITSKSQRQLYVDIMTLCYVCEERHMWTIHGYDQYSEG